MKKNSPLRLQVSMVPASLLIVLLLWAPVAANPFADLKQANYFQVVDTITDEMVHALPDDIHIRLLAIAPIQGDDGSFVDMLTQKIKANTRFHLIERQNLKTLLDEQGIQLSAITDVRDAVVPGRIRGVEALIMGRVDKKTISFFYSQMDIFLKLNHVEGGEIIFARNFTARHISMNAVYIGVILAGLILLFLFGSRIKKKKIIKEKKKVIADDITRQNNIKILKKAKENLTRAHDKLVEKNEMASSTLIMAAGRQVQKFIFQIEQSPGMMPRTLAKGEAGKTAALSGQLQKNIRNVLAESEKLYDRVKNGRVDQVQGNVRDLEQEIKHAVNRYTERTAGQV